MPAITCDAQSLIDAAACLNCALPPGMFGSIEIGLLNQISGLNLTPQQLIDLGTCYQCKIPPGMQGAIILGLLCTISNNNQQSLIVDNGTDPVLGPPYPPINYQLTAHADSPRLTWTVPDVIIQTADIVYSGGPPQLVSRLRIVLTNYDSDVTLTGTTLTVYHANYAGTLPHISSQHPGNPIAFDYEMNNGHPSFLANAVFINEVLNAAHDTVNFTYYVTATSGGITISSNLVSVPLAT